MKISLQAGETMTLDPDVDPYTAAGINLADQTDAQKKLRRLIDRVHPKFKDKLPHWQFLQSTYDGGREWFKTNIHRYLKEGDKEFSDRLDRAYRFNHTREVVDLLNKYLFKQEISRNTVDAPESVTKFWKKATRSGLSIDEFMRHASKRSSIGGRIGIVIDNDAPADAAVTIADEKQSRIQTYAYTVGPEQLRDYSYDEHGELSWVLIQELKRDDSDPLESSGEVVEQFRLWTRHIWMLIQEEKVKGKKIVRVLGAGRHGLGVVPVILMDNIITDEPYDSPSLIDDIAYLDRAVANYLSNLDAIVQDQTFSQLAMPAQSSIGEGSAKDELLELGTKRIFLYDGEGGGAPMYLSPDVKQANLILAVVNKIINEIYHSVGLAGERTKQDNAVGIDNSSGVAKAYDFERVNALLVSKADSLEMVENRMARLVALWNGQRVDPNADDWVTYPDNFDTRSLYDEFDIAARLALISAPDLVRQEQMKGVIEKLFPQLSKDLRSKMESELKRWPITPDEDPSLGGQPKAKPDEKPSPTKKSNQGAVSKDNDVMGDKK